MSKAKRQKKFVLVIVEGPSDEMALGAVLTRVFHSTQVGFQIVYGDVTSQNETTIQNIKSKVADIVKAALNRYRLQPGDINKVIMITDTDGAYCHESAVVEDKSLNKVEYSETMIMCPDRDRILRRNANKSAILDVLSSLPNVLRNIPFELVYMSSNLEHVLYDELGLSDKEKEERSTEFASSYQNNESDFYSVFDLPGLAVKGTRKEVWDFIRQGNHSLERHSNMINCLEDSELKS